MKALVIAEHEDAARELCAGARSLADAVVLASFCEAPEGCADAVARIEPPEGSVLDDSYESLAALFGAGGFGVVLLEPSRQLRGVAGRLAARAGGSALTDVLSFEGPAARSLYFGGVAERLRRPCGGPVAVFTVAPGAFEGLEARGANEPLALPWVEPARPVRLVSSRPLERPGADPSKAAVVVSCGRGFAEREDLGLARALVERLGGALACSRPLAEGAGWLPTSLYVGVSGLSLSPRAYVACGISGQMQHMVGCGRSGTVFAVNKDEGAPIFGQCDWGLVGDLREVLPALCEELDRD